MARIQHLFSSFIDRNVTSNME